jgi:pimeloyl-ACP methyl ester carboxylesterase
MSRPTLVLLHGHMCSPAMWRHQTEALSDRYDVCAPVVGAHSSIRDATQTLLDHLPEQFSVAGFSLGAYIAIDMFRIAAPRIERLALIDTVGHADLPESQAKRDANIARARAGELSAIKREFVKLLDGPVVRKSAALAAELEAMVAAHDTETYCSQQTAMRNRIDASDALGTVRCPTLVAFGREDQLTPPAAHIKIAGQIEHSWLVGIPESAHMSPVEQPHAVTCLLDMLMQMPVRSGQAAR